MTLLVAFSGAVGCGPECGSSTNSYIAGWEGPLESFDLIVDEAISAGLRPGLPEGTWDEWDSDTQCLVTCAVATKMAEREWGDPPALDDAFPLIGLVEFAPDSSCSLTLPTADAPASLECSATVLVYYEELCSSRSSGGGFGCDGLTLPGGDGRRPLEWHEEQPTGRLDKAALLEQVSITAFEELAAQLSHHGAPPELIARCRAAAVDEARHVELVVGLGAARPSGPPPASTPEASLLKIALHNATEGCVAETWAAMLAGLQARAAPSPAFRSAYAEIAADESRHGQLAWDLHDWMMTRLDPRAAATIQLARTRALADLPASALAQMRAIDSSEREQLGLPEPHQAAAIARSLIERLGYTRDARAREGHSVS